MYLLYISYTHLCTNGGVNHARQQPMRREQLGFVVLLRDTSTLIPASKWSQQPSGCQTTTVPPPPSWGTLIWVHGGRKRKKGKKGGEENRKKREKRH